MVARWAVGDELKLGEAWAWGSPEHPAQAQAACSSYSLPPTPNSVLALGFSQSERGMEPWMDSECRVSSQRGWVTKRKWRPWEPSPVSPALFTPGLTKGAWAGGLEMGRAGSFHPLSWAPRLANSWAPAPLASVGP